MISSSPPVVPERRRPSLTARWSNLILLTYPVHEDLVRPWLARDVEPDLVDGQAQVSLIAFDFVDTRVRGRRIPGFVDFPEINFRTYVRQGDRRGVAVLRELVPSPLAAAIGRLRFNEPFRSAPMESRTASLGDELVVEHRWRWKSGRHFVRVTADQNSDAAPADGPVPDLLGRRWAFGRSAEGGSDRTSGGTPGVGAATGPHARFRRGLRRALRPRVGRTEPAPAGIHLPGRRFGGLDLPSWALNARDRPSASGTAPVPHPLPFAR